MKRIYMLILFLLASQCAFACGGFTDSVADALSDDVRSRLNKISPNQLVDFRSIERACEALERRPELSIVVVPYIRGFSDSNPGNFGFSLAIVDEVKRSVVARLDEFNYLAVDAIQPTAVGIVTGGYFSGDLPSAFGIKITRRNYMSAVEVTEEITNLYLIERGGIREILRGMLTYSSIVELFDHECDPSTRDERVKIVVKKPMRSKHLDLVMDRTIEQFTHIGTGDDCKRVKKQIDSRRYILKYDGRRFRV